MKWRFVSSGANKVITFVALEKSGRPIKSFKSHDMGLAYHYEQGKDFKNSISEFNKQSSRRIEALQNGKQIPDDRDIIDIAEFKRELKKDGYTVKANAREPWVFSEIKSKKKR
jgi:hypothetical protein